MLLKSIKNILLFSVICICNLDLTKAQDLQSVDYHFIYVTLSENDNTDYSKLIKELQRVNSEFRKDNDKYVLYFSKGLIKFNTDDLNEWNNLYTLINGNSIAHLNASEEIEIMLELFKKNEFSSIIHNKLFFSNYNNIFWHVYIGKGFWQSGNNKDILGILLASCGIYDNVSKFKLNIYNDSNDPISNFSSVDALGKYYNFTTGYNTTLKKY